MKVTTKDIENALETLNGLSKRFYLTNGKNLEVCCLGSLGITHIALCKNKKELYKVIHAIIRYVNEEKRLES